MKIDTTLSSWNSPNRKSVEGVPEVMLHDEAAELIPLSVCCRWLDCSIMSTYSSAFGGGSLGTYRSSARLEAPELLVYTLLE